MKRDSYNNRKFISKLIIGLIVILLLIIFVVIYGLHIRDKQEEINEEIISLIDEGIKDNRIEEVVEDLQSSYEFEIVVYFNDEKFSTFDSDYEYQRNNLDRDIINYEALNKAENYDYWIAIYNISFIQNLDSMLYIIVILSCFAVQILVLSMYVFFRKTIKPIETLYDGVVNITNDPYSADEEKQKQFNVELESLAKNIKLIGSNVAQEYNYLEKDIELYKQTIASKNDLVYSLVHELKTPLSILSAYVSEVESLELRNKMELKINDVVMQVKNIMQLYKNQELFEQNTEFDINYEIREIVKNFNPVLLENGIFINVNLKGETLINSNLIEFKLIINNAISNINSYAKKDSEVFIELEKTEKFIKITFENEVDNIKNVKFDKVFDLNFSSGNKNLKDGFGMYSIKKLARANNAEVKFYNKDELVCLEITYIMGSKNEA